jgi:hypothetical protein
LIDSSCRLGNTPEEEEEDEEEEASAKAGHIYPLPVSRTHGVSTAPHCTSFGVDEYRALFHEQTNKVGHTRLP